MATSDDNPVLKRFLKDLQAAKKDQDKLRERYKACDEIWGAVLKANAASAQWESNLHPPLALSLAETYLSNLVVDSPTQRVHPALPGKQDAAKYLELLIHKQRAKDRFPTKWHEFCQQAVIRPLTVAKIPWVYETRTVRERVTGQGPLGVGDTDKWREIVTKNQPSFVPVDVRNFWWDPAATDIESAEWVIWRDFICWDDLEDMQKAGLVDNLDEIKASRTVGSNTPEGTEDEKRDLKGRIEIHEQWFRDRLLVVADRRVVLRDERNPFGHGKLPFVKASVITVPFSFVGKSLMELIAENQAEVWDLKNQALDNTKFMANAVPIIDPAIAADFTKAAPGQAVEGRKDQIDFWQPNISVLGPAYQAIQDAKNEMADVSGITAYTGGASQGQQVDVNTATGIQLMQNMGQQRIIMGKQQVMNALREVGTQQVMLNQILLPAPLAIRTTNSEDAQWLTISAECIQGEFDFYVEDVAESLDRQTRRQEALTRAQVYAGLFAQLAQTAMQQGVILDFPALVGDLNESFDEPKDKYLAAAPPPPMMPPGGAPPLPPGGMPPGASAPPPGVSAAPAAPGGAA